MLIPLENKILQFIKNHRLILPGERVLSALSGGVDSAALLHLLYKLRDVLRFHLAAAHFNHRLRGEESQRDENFCRQLAGDYKIEFFSGEWDSTLKKSQASLQMAAHNARFNFLNSVATAQGCHKIALGHNLDDQLETVLMSFLRGCGWEGLQGILPLSGNRIHPLLGTSRAEIEKYAANEGLNWVEDSTNQEDKYLRNRVRNELLPLTRDIFPQLDTALLRLSFEAAELENWYDAQFSSLEKKGLLKVENSDLILDIDLFLQYFTMLRKKILLTIFERFDPLLHPSQGLLTEIDRLCALKTGSWVDCGKFLVSQDRLHLRFQEKSKNDFEAVLKPETVCSLPGGTISAEVVALPEVEYNSDSNTEFLDWEKLHGALIVRNWRQGDDFIPLGMKNPKKLSDYFIEKKIPRLRKKEIPLLCDNEKIIWVVGMRLDERVKITPDSLRILKLTWRPRKR